MLDTLDSTFLRIFEKSANSLVIKADPPRFTMLAASDEYLAISGTTRDELIGKGVFEVFTDNLTYPTGALRAYNAFLEVIQTKQTVSLPIYEYEIPSPVTGQLEPFYWSNTNVPILGDDGEVEYILNTTTNITEQVLLKHREQEINRELDYQQQKVNRMFEQAPVAISLLRGSELLIESANRQILQLWGKSTSIIGLPIVEALPEIVEQGFTDLLTGVYTSGVAHYGYETLARLNHGGQLVEAYFNFVYAPIRDVDGSINGVMVVATEVTGQVKAKQALQVSEKRFRTLLEAIAQMTWTNTPEGELTFYNQRWYDYTGLSAEQTRNQGWLAVIHPDDLAPTLQAFQQALASGETFEIENRYKRGSDGVYRWHLNRALPIRDEQGTITLWVGTATDIHEQKHLSSELEKQVKARTEQLQVSNYDLRRSNDNLQQFAYIASHDLQEPLRKIQSFGDLLKTNYSDQLGEGLDHLIRMQSAASRMSILIKDLLTFSRISTRQDAATPVSLNQVLTTVLENLEMAVLETGATVEVDLLPTVVGDESQLQQLFQNLLSNALKFHRLGVSPVVRVNAELLPRASLPSGVNPSRSASAYHRISVSDNGIGFDEKYIDRIFQVFQRLHGKNQYEGTGIGLAICEKVVINHGGAICANSQPGSGATFQVYLPA